MAGKHNERVPAAIRPMNRRVGAVVEGLKEDSEIYQGEASGVLRVLDYKLHVWGEELTTASTLERQLAHLRSDLEKRNKANNRARRRLGGLGSYFGEGRRQRSIDEITESIQLRQGILGEGFRIIGNIRKEMEFGWEHYHGLYRALGRKRELVRANQRGGPMVTSERMRGFLKRQR